MSDEVIFQDRQGPSGDPLDQENLSKRRAQSNSTHYVERGLGLTPDYSNDDVEVASGHAVIRDERGAEPKAYDVFPDGRTGSDAINLTDGEVNELYLVIDPATNDDVWYDARTDGTTPSKPSLHVGTVDLASNSTSTVSRRPDVSVNHADAREVSAESIANIADHVITPTDDLQSLFANDVSAGDTVYIGPGTATKSLTSTNDGHVFEIGVDNVTVVLHSDCTLKLADSELSSGDSGRLISIANGVTGPTIVGDGTLDGNKDGSNSVDSPEDFALIKFKDNVSDVRIGYGLSFQGSPGQTIRPDASSGNEITGLRIIDFDVADCSEGIVWTHANDVIVSKFDIENIFDQDALEPVESEDWVIGPGLIDTTDQSGVDVFTNARDGKIHSLTIRNPGQSGEHGVTIRSSNGGPHDIDCSNVTVIGAGSGSNTSANAFNVGGNCENVDLNECEARGAEQYGARVAGGAVNCDLIDFDSQECGRSGVRHNGDEAQIRGGTAKNNNQEGLNNFAGWMFDGDRQTVVGITAYDDQGTGTQEKGIYLMSNMSNGWVDSYHAWGNTEDNLFNNSTASTDLGSGKTA